MTGRVYNRLTVLGYLGRDKQRLALWLCRCECGVVKSIRGTALRNGTILSCGCLSREINSRQFRTHGHSYKREYAIYAQARQRCVNPKNGGFHKYGGRGIEFRFSCFEDFIEAVGFRPTPQHSLDRIDNDGHYEKGNLRWATPSEQAHNTRTNRTLTIDGETKILSDWSRATGESTSNIIARIKRGWCVKCSVYGVRCSHR